MINLKIKSTAEDINVPPTGYEFVSSGKIRRSDKVWDEYNKKWRHPSNEDFQCVGNLVSLYFAVCRREPYEPI